MQHVPSSLFVTRSRSFFSPNNARPLGGGVEMWSGFFQSVRPAQSGLVLNIDVSATAFNEARPVIEIAGETWRKPPQMMVGFQPNDADRRTLERVLHLTQVETTHRADFKRRYRVKGICREPADREM